MSDTAHNAVVPVDLTTSPVTVGTPIPVATSPLGIAFSPDGSMAYVAGPGNGTVTPITVASNTPGTPISGVGTSPNQIAITPDGKTAYVTDNGSNKVYPIALPAGTVGSPISVGTGVTPLGIAITPDGTKAYTANFGPASNFGGTGNTVTPIDSVEQHRRHADHGRRRPMVDRGDARLKDRLCRQLQRQHGHADRCRNRHGRSRDHRGGRPALTRDHPGSGAGGELRGNQRRAGSADDVRRLILDGAVRDNRLLPVGLRRRQPAGDHDHADDQSRVRGLGQLYSDGDRDLERRHLHRRRGVHGTDRVTCRQPQCAGEPLGDHRRGSQPAVSVSAHSLDFGTIAIGHTSLPQAITVTNSGQAPLVISSAVLAGANKGDYNVTGDTCSRHTIAAGGTCTTTLTFTPGGTGARVAQLGYTDNASGSPHTIALSGIGTHRVTLAGT